MTTSWHDLLITPHALSWCPPIESEYPAKSKPCVHQLDYVPQA